jgi:hypothetical protein
MFQIFINELDDFEGVRGLDKIFGIGPRMAPRAFCKPTSQKRDVGHPISWWSDLGDPLGF